MAISQHEAIRKCAICGKSKVAECEPDYDYSTLADSCVRYLEETFICSECKEKNTMEVE